jgi:hypothetical protein
MSDGTVRKRKKKRAVFEKTLYISLFITLGVLLAVQVFQLSSQFQPLYAWSDKSEGEPLGAEEYLFEKVYLRVSLKNGEVNENIKILVNGDVVSNFSKNSVNLELLAGDIIELDTSESASTNADLTIHISEGYSLQKSGQTTDKAKNVKILGKVTKYCAK